MAAAAAAAAGLLAGGCAGAIGDATGGSPGGAGGSSADDQTITEPTGLPAPLACTSDSPGPRALRRLTAGQYASTLRDLFRDPNVPQADIFSDPIVLGFSADANRLVVQGLTAQQIMNHAEEVAHWAVTTHLPDLAPSCMTTDAGCRQELIRSFGKRAFRAPLDDARVQAYDALFAAENSFSDGAEAVISAMLQSPYFLYRTELGVADGSGTFALTPYEVASGLSYLLTGSMPDDQLLAAADAGTLAGDGLDSEARRLLAAAPTGGEVQTFFRGWLGLDRFDTAVKDDTVFKLPDSIRQEMKTETAMLIADTFARGGTVADLLTAPYTFANRELAQYYGLAAASGLGDTFQQVAIAPGERDPGLLAHGDLLTGYADADISSPVLRGKLVRVKLLCQSLPPAPTELYTMLQPPSQPETTRDHFAAHDQNAICAGCHKLMDPIGFGFEGYDAWGRPRTQENGFPVDTSGTVVGPPEGGDDHAFNGVTELASYLASSGDAQQCLVRYWSYYAFGLLSWDQDACTYAAVASDAAAQQGSLPAVLMGIVHAPRFQRRVQDN